MSFVRLLGLVLFVLGGVSLVAASGAFTDVSLDRTSDVAVTDDQSGLVGLDIAQPVDGQGNGRLVTLTNNADEEMTLTVALTVNTDPGVSLPSGQRTNTLAPGESATVDVTVNPSQNPQVVEFSVTGSATTGDVEVSLIRSTTVEQVQTGPCAGPRTVYDENVNGDIEVETGSVEIASNVRVTGGVEAPGCVILRSNAQVNGEVEAGKDVRLGSKAKIKSSVESGGDVTLADGAATQIKGEVEADGSVTLGSKAKIQQGSVESGGDVTLGSKAQIQGGVESGGDVTLGPKAQIKGDVEADGSVTLGPGAKIQGEVESG